MDDQDLNQSNSKSGSGFDASALAPAAIGWGIAALTLSILGVNYNTSSMVVHASVWALVFAVIMGTILGTAGALLGDALRKFAMPSAVFTRGGMGSLIWIRIFWSIGPQFIGLLVGIGAGASWVLS